MSFDDWKKKLAEYENLEAEAAVSLEAARFRKNVFLKETLGFEERGVATLSGTAEMIFKIVRMMEERKVS